MSRQIVLVAVAALTFAPIATYAQDSGWSSGYQMGQSYAGVALGEKSRMTFSCAGPHARVLPGKSGPSLTVALPKAQATQPDSGAIEIVADGKAMRIPVTAEPDIDTLSLVWSPRREFGVAKMKPVVAALRKAKTIEVRAAGATLAVPTLKASEALKDDPLSCS